jgi:hypothetical protein
MLKKLLLATTALFTLFVAPAHAGPLAAGIGALLSTSLGAGITVGSIALGFASMGAQWLISMLLAPEVEQKGVKTKIDTGGDNPPSFILGEYCTAGQLIYANVFDKSGYNIENACLVYVIQLSCIPVNGLSNTVYANNEKVTINPGPSWPGGFMQVDEYVKGASGGGYFLVKFYDGTQNTADSWLLDKFGSDPDRPWQNDMIGEGCAYVIVQAWYSNRGIWTGIPDLRWVVQGASLYDPRKDSTVGGSGSQRRNNQSTWTFSKNAKVIEYNTHIGIRYDGEHLWGGDAEAYRLPLDYWFAAMNVCDENVGKAAGGSVKRYEVGCEIHLDDKPIDIVTEINKSCSGYTTEFGGTYKTWCGGPGLPVGSITDDDFLITAEQETNKFQSQQATYNTAYATYPEPRQQWEPKDGPRYQDDDALEEDGEELALDMTLPFVTENNQVQRLMRAAIKDSRRQVTHEGILPPIAWVYEPFDCLTYYSELFGYGPSGKDVIIGSKDDLPDVNQRVLLREVNANDQGWLPAYEQDFDTAPLVIVTPGTLVLDVTVAADQVDTTVGKDKPAIRVDWTWGTTELAVQRLKWEIRYPSTTKVIAEGTINNPDDGTALVANDILRFGKAYEIRFMGIPYATRDADWTGWKSVTCVIVDVPAAPSLTRVSKLGSDGKLSYFVDVAWTPVSQEATYIVRTIVDGQNVRYPADGTPLRIPVAAGSTLVVDVAAFGAETTRGNFSSTTSITVTKKNTAPTAPTSLTATGKIGRIDLKTNKNPDSDFDHFNLYGSNTNDFTTAVLLDDPKSIRFQEGDLGNAVTRYYWVTAVDSSGNESTKFPVSNTAGRTATTARVGAADIDDGAITAPKLGTQSVTPVKLLRGADSSNIVIDNDMFEGAALWSQGSGGGVPTRVRNNSAGGSSEWALNQAQTTGIKEIYSVQFPVKGGKTYAVAATLGPLTAVSATMTFIINWYSLDGSGALVFISSASLSWTGTTQDYKSFLAKAPAGARRSQLIARIAAGPDVGLWYSDPMVRRATEADLLAADAVTDDKIVARDQSNMIRNANADILALWTGTGGTLATTPSADVSESANTLSIPASTAALTISTLSDIPVKAGKAYYIAGVLGPSNGVSCDTYLQVLWFSMNAAGVQTFISSNNTAIVTGTTISERERIFTAPANARRAILRAGKNTSASAADLAFYGPIFRKAVEDSQTDQTAPTAPTVALAGYGADFDQDGTLDAGITITATNPNIGREIKSYIVEVQRSDTVGGTYTNWRRFAFDAEDAADSLTTVFQLPANRKKFYRARIRSVTGNAKKKSTWSGYTSPGIQPSAATGYTGAAASAPSVAQVAGGFRIGWGFGALDTSIYKETEVLVGGVTVIRTSGTEYVDMTARTIGSTYTFTVKHYDKQGGVTNASTGVVSPAYRGLLSAELGAGRGTNLLINTNANLGLNYWAIGVDINSNNTFQTALVGGAGASWAPVGEDCFQIFQGNDGITGGYTSVYQRDAFNVDHRKIPVKANQRYEMHLLTGCHRCTGRAFIMWYNAAGTNLSNSVTDDNAGTQTGGQLLTGYKQIGVFATAPATAAYAIIMVRKLNTTLTTDTSSYLFFTHMFFGEAGANQTEYSPWAENGNLIVTNGITDQTLRAAPTGISLTQANKDVDLDGSVDIALLATFSTGVAGAANYEFELSRSTTSGGTYSVIETKPSPTGKVWFQANTQYFYKVRVRSINWDGTPGTWSSLVGPVQPTGVTSAPAVPTNTILIGYGLSWLVVWDMPPELDYDHTDIAILASAGTPNPSTDIIDVVIGERGYVAQPFDQPRFVYARHVNTSGQASAWHQFNPFALSPGGVTSVAPFAGGKAALNNLGTSNSGSVNAGTGSSTLLTLTFKCTSNTSGVTVNLGGYSVTMDFVNQEVNTITTTEITGGSFSYSKTGGGTVSGVQLSAVTLP